MRVLQVMAGAEHGGAETYFLDTVCALAGAGVEQMVVTRPEPHRLARLQAAGVPVRQAGFSNLVPFLTRGVVGEVAAAFRPDLVQAWMGRAGSMLPRLDGPVIGWFGGYYDLRRFRTCTDFVGVSHDLGRHIRAAGAPAERVHVIHTFADLDDAPALDRAQFDTPADAPLLLALARLHWKKGIDVLLRALAGLPQAHLWIAGEGPLRAELEQLAATLGVQSRVRFLGWRTDRGAMLRAADLCVFPSRYEPFGTVMVEAWGTGVPIVAAAAAGPKAYIEHEVNGLLVDIDDVAGLAAAVGRCLGDAALRTRLAAGGRRTFEATFTREKIVQSYQELFIRLLARGGA